MNYVVLFLLAFAISFGSWAQDQVQMLKQIQTTYRPDFISSDKQSWLSDIQKYSNELTKQGQWTDIDYSAIESLDFSPKTHLSRAAVMAEGYGTPGQANYQSAVLLSKIRLALLHWFEEDYKSYNWWHNEIGVQQYILRALILTGNDLGEDILDEAMKILRRTSLSQTGQNRMWRGEIVYVRSILQNKMSGAKRAARDVEKLLKFGEEEGIQPDGSFLQHGNLIYNGGYGDKFILLMAKFISMTNGSIFEFGPLSKQSLIDYVLNSQLWLTRNNKYDFGVMGRSIAIKSRNALNLGLTCQLLSQMNVKEKAPLQNCAERILNNKVSGLQGNKVFWNADFAVQQEKDYFATIRMFSTRTINNDAPSNGEGLMSHHLADGAMMIQKDGTEYENIFPVWDWNKIPGTTTEQKAIIPAQFVPEKPELFAHMRSMGQSDFVGSVSDGRYGASSIDFISTTLKAQKSWFFFDKVIWALGSDIQYSGREEVKTTLNQTKSKTDVKLIGSERQVVTFEEEEVELKDVFALLHQNVGYVFPKKQQVTVSNKIQKGDWKKINASMESEVASEKVFTATIDHGKSKLTGSYEYLILPETNVKELEQLDVSEKFDYLNTKKIQGVYSKNQKILQAVVYEEMSFEMAGHTIEVSDPCLIMVDFSGKSLVLRVSDPTQKKRKLTVKIDGKEYKAVFLSGKMKGSTVVGVVKI